MARSPRENYLSWDECLMQMAHVISQRSKDPSTQTGAVIVDQKNVIVGMGYNGWPRGTDHEFPWDSEGDILDIKNTYVVHAEENAIYNANHSTKDCVLYCLLFPCNECAKTIVQMGIKEVVFESDRNHNRPIWVASRRILDAAGVTYREYKSSLAPKEE